MLIIFDCDGVLVDSELLANRVLAAHLTRLGHSTSPDQSMRLYMGHSMKENMKKIEARFASPLPEDFLDTLQKETFRLFEQHLEAVPGVDEVLCYLNNVRRPFCVASSGDFEKLQLTLNKTGLIKYFCSQGEGRNIFSATEVAFGKPSPDLFFHAARSMGALPAQTLVIEDSVPGVNAALAAGMNVLAHLPRNLPADFREQQKALLESSGASLFEDMRELLVLLKADVRSECL
ncbi:MAG: HAD family hydrolase [Pseudomonadales bacterium]|nr:HAD family hydrolase [Pseudomonadales bacterium]